MLGQIKMHDVVALLQDVPAKHFESGRALLLRRGQIGTVVVSYPHSVYEVEFASVSLLLLPLCFVSLDRETVKWIAQDIEIENL